MTIKSYLNPSMPEGKSGVSILLNEAPDKLALTAGTMARAVEAIALQIRDTQKEDFGPLLEILQRLVDYYDVNPDSNDEENSRWINENADIVTAQNVFVVMPVVGDLSEIDQKRTSYLCFLKDRLGVLHTRFGIMEVRNEPCLVSPAEQIALATLSKGGGVIRTESTASLQSWDRTLDK